MQEIKEAAAPVVERPSAIPQGIQMPAQQIRNAIREAVALDKITEDEGEVIFWLYSYAREFHLGYKGLSEKVRLAENTIYQVFHGSYGAASWKSVVREIQAFQKVELEELKKKNIGFVQTDTARTIFRVCETALSDGMPAFIYGASQLGKTTALLEFQRTHNHGKTKYLRLGSHWTKHRLVHELATVCNCGGKALKSWMLEDAIFGSLTRYNLLIVDEFHLAIETTTDQRSKEIMEFIREVYDRTGCGLVMSSTKVGLEGLENGRNKMLFDQLRRRGVVKVVLPDVPSVKDINAVARSFDLDIPHGDTLATIKLLLKMRGLGVYIKYLQMAYKLSKEDKRPISWEYFINVLNGYARLAEMKAEY